MDPARKSKVEGCDGRVDENCNRKSKFDLEQRPLSAVSSAFDKDVDTLDKDNNVAAESKENENTNHAKSKSSFENDPHIGIGQSEVGLFVLGTLDEGSGSFVKDNKVSPESFQNQKHFNGELCAISKNEPDIAMRQTTISPVVSGTSEADDTWEEQDDKVPANSFGMGDQVNVECFSNVPIKTDTAMNKSKVDPIIRNNVTSGCQRNISDSSLITEELVSPQSLRELADDGYFHAKLLQANSDIENEAETCVSVAACGNLSTSSLVDNEDVSACVEQQQRKESRKALKKVDSECQKVSLR